MLQIAPSKTDTERLLVVSPELAGCVAEIITRFRATAGRCRWWPPTTPRAGVEPPMPLLFQRRIGGWRTAPIGGPSASAS